MERSSRQRPEIRDFILKNVEKHPKDITTFTAKHFGITRAAINRYINRLIFEGFISAEGNTSSRHYQINFFVDELFPIKVLDGLEEDIVWRYRVLPLMKGVNQNVIDLCQYGFTEMLNNVIDHSASFDAIIRYKQSYTEISLTISDSGIGIFEKIQRDFKLADARSALLELSKGRLTSDPAKHAGEGIFFTSRMFDKFCIMSQTLFYSRERQNDDDWLIESGDKSNEPGTYVRMTVSTDASWTPKEVFTKYQNDGYGFRKTHVPLKLGNYPGEQLVSRSQAKRVLARFDNFSEIMLDFRGVQSIGQPFADEIFRVFKNSHPDIKIVPVGITPEIKKMIEYIQSGKSDSSDKQGTLF